MVLQPLLLVRVAAIFIGVAVFWILSNDNKKKTVESYLSLLTTWILFFIGAKLVTQWELLLDYPLSVLAYPSGTVEFYIASVATILFECRKREQHQSFIYSYIIMIASSLVSFAFLARLVLEQGHAVDLMLAFSFFLLVMLWRRVEWIILLVAGGAVVSGFIFRAPSLMGYRMDIWFYLVILIIGIGVILLKKGGRNNGR